MPDPSRTRASARPRPSGQEVRLLLQGHPEAVLARLVDGDPLGVRPVVGGRLRARWLVLDADRVHLRSLALLAHEGGTWSGRPRLVRWLEGLIDRAIDEVLAEGPPALSGVKAAPIEAEFARPLGLDPEVAVKLPWILAARPDSVRRAFVRLVLDGDDLDTIARDEEVSASEVGRRARSALDALQVVEGEA